VKQNDDPAATGRFHSASAYERLVGFSRAVRRGSRICVSGTAPIDDDGETVEGDAYVQATRCFEIILEAVEALGGTREDVVRTRIFVVDAADWEGVGRAHGECFREVYPAATMVVVKGLLDPRWRVEIEADAELLS
jgi:enamine deaminase RidA (YjgF/YER057c/UK114 family)